MAAHQARLNSAPTRRQAFWRARFAGPVVGLLWAIAWTVAATAADVTASPPNDRIPEEIQRCLPRADDEAGFRLLLGQTAPEGWVQCGPGGFTVTNGVATSHGGMGLWWYTNRMFTNFIVRGEWRFENRESDTGVFVRFPDPGQDPWNAVRLGHELELGDDPAGQDPTWRSGALYPFQPPTHVPTKPVGEWNAFELSVVDHTYVVRINGETVTVWTDPARRSAAGFLGLQNYQAGKGVQHRRLRVRELPVLQGAAGALGCARKWWLYG